MTKSYKIVKFGTREIVSSHATFAAAAAALRKLSAEYFMQASKRAWFFADVQLSSRARKTGNGINAAAWFARQSFNGRLY